MIEYHEIVKVWERLKSIDGYSARPVYIDKNAKPPCLRIGHAQLRPRPQFWHVGHYDAFADLQALVADVRKTEAEHAN